MTELQKEICSRFIQVIGDGRCELYLGRKRIRVIQSGNEIELAHVDSGYVGIFNFTYSYSRRVYGFEIHLIMDSVNSFTYCTLS